MNLDKNLLNTIFKIVFIRLGSFVFMFPFSILVSRSLGAEDYGVYGIVTAVAAILVVLCTFGSDQFVVKNISAMGIDDLYVKKILATSISLSFIIVVITVVICLLLYYIYGNKIFVLTCIVLPFMVFGKYSLAILRGVEKTILSGITQNFIQPCICLISVVCLYFFDNINIFSVIFAVTFSYLCSFVFSSYFQLSTYISLIKLQKILHVKTLVSLSYPFIGLTITNSLITYSDRIMIGYLDSYEQAGIYLVAARNASLMMICFGCAQYVLTPKIAQFKGKSIEYIQNIANLHLIFLVIVGSFFYLSLFLFSDYSLYMNLSNKVKDLSGNQMMIQ